MTDVTATKASLASSQNNYSIRKPATVYSACHKVLSGVVYVIQMTKADPVLLGIKKKVLNTSSTIAFNSQSSTSLQKFYIETVGQLLKHPCVQMIINVILQHSLTI